MSATAFQRMRREQAAKRAAEESARFAASQEPEADDALTAEPEPEPKRAKSKAKK